MSTLNSTETILVWVASYEVSRLAGNAIAEACRMKNAGLFECILINYKNIVNTIDFTEFATRYVLPLVRESHGLLFKQLLEHAVK